MKRWNLPLHWLAVPVLLLPVALVSRTDVAATKDTAVTVDLNGAPFEDALEAVAGRSGRSIKLEPGATVANRPVTLRLRQVPVEAAVKQVARAAGAEVKISENEITAGETGSDDLTPPVLDTRIYGQTRFLPNAPAGLRVVVLKHETQEPVPNADIAITLTRTAVPGPQGSPGFARSVYRGRTDAGGSVNAVFRIPDVPAGSYGLNVVASALRERDRLAQTISVTPAAQILVTTDKPVYQPGQVIHIRALALERPDRSPVDGADAVIEVADGKGNKVFKHREKTSAYGIVAADFTLATEVNMGAYKVTVSAGGASQEKTVTVDRYVLPKFKVAFKPDRTFYMPGERLTGAVDAAYFFGKPVAGTVKIAFASFDAGFNEFATLNGTLDATGHFKVEQALPTFFAGQPLEQGNAFVKAEITVTDTADHSEKATVSVPIASQPIKVTVIPESTTVVPNTRNRLYVVTSYPDGTPAATTYRLEVRPEQSKATVRDPLRTDESGLGFVEYTPPSGQLTVLASASDGNGRRGETKLVMAQSDAAGILLRADRSLYRAGDTMRLTALSPEGRATIYFDVLRDKQTVLTKTEDLREGRADIDITLGEDLTGTLEVHAYRIGRDGNIRRDSRIVYVDPADDLKVAVTPDKETYLPGENARVRFAVTGPDGSPRPAALGVAIVDESVFALQEMQPGMEKVYFMLEKEILEPRYEIHGFSGRDIVQPMPAVRGIERQRAAGALFASLPRKDSVAMLATSYTGKQAALVSRAYRAVAREAETIRKALVAYEKKTGAWPAEGVNVLALLVRDGYLKQADVQDPWGRVYVINPQGNIGSSFTLHSIGPDRKDSTGDEIYVWVGTGQPVREEQPVPLMAQGAGGVWMDGDIMLGAPVRRGMALEDLGALPAGAVAKGMGLDELRADSSLAVSEPAVRVREYFPETLLFEPSLITDNTGQASLEVPMADSITTWRLTAMASSRQGALGSVTAPMRAFQDFFVDINFPVRLTQGDEVSVPVSVYNYLDSQQTVTLTAEKEDWFEMLDEPVQKVSLGPNEVKGVRYRVRATGLGFRKLTVRAQGNSRADAVRREVEIVPNGKRIEQAWNGRLTGNARQVVPIPAGAIADASNILIKVYPGVFSTVLEGMDNIFRMPFGCFEQTSSVTYPNILVLDYLKRTKKVTPEIQMKAEQYVNLGYQRLVAYEVPGGGFSWFGSAPANKVLTAYGLQEFADMSRVWDVDPAMISRTRAWVAGQQNADGSWTPDPNYIDEGLGPMWKSNLLSTAYITWGMAESGRTEAGPAGDDSVNKALNYLRGHAKEAQDAYALAVLANAMVAAAPEDPATKDVLDRLVREKTDEQNDQTYWKTTQATVTFAGGDSANVETTAMAAYALIRAGVHPDVASRALNWLVAKRDPAGTWGSTQATIMTLRAMVAGLGAQTQRGEATIKVMVNGQEAGEVKVTPENSDVMQQVDAKNLVRTGDNDVQLLVSGTGSMMYGITSYYHVPWNQVRVEKGPLDIKVEYDRARLARDEMLTAKLTVTYTPVLMAAGDAATLRPGLILPPKYANMVVVDLGIPPGFVVDTSELEDLVASKTVSRYEMTGRQAILYFERIEANKPVVLSVKMRAQYPLKASTPQSVVYEYYNPDSRAVADPVKVEVTES